MVAVPASGVSSVTRILNSVVLPPPSGPMNPNSSPDLTSNDTPSSAVLEANFLTTLSAATAVVIDVATLEGSLRELRRGKAKASPYTLHELRLPTTRGPAARSGCLCH